MGYTYHTWIVRSWFDALLCHFACLSMLGLLQLRYSRATFISTPLVNGYYVMFLYDQINIDPSLTFTVPWLDVYYWPMNIYIYYLLIDLWWSISNLWLHILHPFNLISSESRDGGLIERGHSFRRWVIIIASCYHPHARWSGSMLMGSRHGLRNKSYGWDALRYGQTGCRNLCNCCIFIAATCDLQQLELVQEFYGTKNVSEIIVWEEDSKVSCKRPRYGRMGALKEIYPSSNISVPIHENETMGCKIRLFCLYKGFNTAQ